MTDPFALDAPPRLVAEPVPGDNAPPLAVSELAGKLKRLVEGEFGHVRLRGEISGWKRAASGHAYLCLKDDAAVIDGVIWKGQAALIPFAPQDGIEVIATGRLTTYPGRSKYQIVIDRLELAGEGALMALLERNKAAFDAEGLFAKSKARRPLPHLPRTIGVVTSPTGAVIRDILHRLEDRFPSHVVVWPVKVQGEGAAAEVAAAVRGFDGLPEAERPDLVIVARGGGSIEDLWAFNEEAVVRAVAACRVPVISAVGHETDTTLCDFAADLRAPTPTAAAELAVPVLADLRLMLGGFGQRIERCARRYHERGRERLDALIRVLPRRDALLGPQRQRADDAARRLDLALERRAARARTGLDRAGAGLRPAILSRQFASAKDRVERTWQLVEALAPQRVLDRGYALVTRRDGVILANAGEARAADMLTLRFHDGEVAARVERAKRQAYGAPRPDQPTLL